MSRFGRSGEDKNPFPWRELNPGSHLLYGLSCDIDIANGRMLKVPSRDFQ
jgi:hypothetical protein